MEFWHEGLSFNLKKLPSDWKDFPHSENTQEIGEKFISANEYLVMQVPSAVVLGDFNFLINPKHKDFDKVKIIGKALFTFDKRLFK